MAFGWIGCTRLVQMADLCSDSEPDTLIDRSAESAVHTGSGGGAYRWRRG